MESLMSDIPDKFQVVWTPDKIALKMYLFKDFVTVFIFVLKFAVIKF